MYSKEDCSRNDPSISPGSRSGRGAMTLTPSPNRAKAFNIADSNTVPRLRRDDVRPLGQAAWVSVRHKVLVYLVVGSRFLFARQTQTICILKDYLATNGVFITHFGKKLVLCIST